MFYEGQEIGSYVLIGKLGRGGFGEVWLAERRSQLVTKKVAVKLPLDEQVNFDAIRQEAALWEQASGHPNVLPIIDADVYNRQVVIVSEYAEGGSLHDKLKAAGKLPGKQAVELTIGILDGLEFLHHKQIIHRDIKPQNILLQGNTPRLADFGISRAMQATAVSSQIIGTDSYMSPETFEGYRSVQTDIWAVGVVLYQLLTGRLPFPQEHPTEKMFAILMKDFEPLPADVPPNLQNIIKKALAKNPAERFQSASAMSEELKNFLYDRPSNAPAPTQAAIPQNFATLPSVGGEKIPETIQFKPLTEPPLSAAETLVYEARPTQPERIEPKKSHLKPVVIAVCLVLLLGGVLTGGYFGFQKFFALYQAEKNLQSSLRDLSAQDMEMLLEDFPPQQLKIITDDPEKKKDLAKQIKQLLAVAAEAEASGYGEKPEIKIYLDFAEKSTIAQAYDKRKSAGSQAAQFSSISDEDAKTYMEKPGNQQKFDEFLKTAKYSASKDKELPDAQVMEAKKQWAKIQIAYERAMAEQANFSPKELHKIELQVKLQKAQFLAQKYSEEILAPKTKATDAEIEDYKNKHSELNTKDKKNRAEQIIQRLKNGEDFAKLADELSEDPGTKNKGGLYENVPKGQMVLEFEQAALALEPGQITPNPVKTQFGYHIIKLERKGQTKGKDGQMTETYNVRHILISIMMKDPDNPTGPDLSINDFVSKKIEDEKQKQIFDELIAKHKITVSENFKVPQGAN